MTNQPVALGSTCAACGAGRKVRNLRYDPNTFLPYCEKTHICNDDHPNSYLNVIVRGKITDLVTAEEISGAYQAHLISQYDPEMAEKLHRIVVKPTTLRIMDPEMAEYLVNLQKELALPSLAETIRHCIQLNMENEGAYFREKREVVKETKKEEAVQTLAEELEKEPVTVPDKPNEEGWEF